MRSYFCTSILWIIFPCKYYILNDVTPFIEYLQVCSPRINFLKTGTYLKYINTWSYENRVSKHFVICVNFPCLIASLLCCLLMSVFFLLVFWWGISVEVSVDRITILPALPIFFHTHNSLFDTSQTVIWNQCTPKAGFSAV